jgi:hypothetical protein
MITPNKTKFSDDLAPDFEDDILNPKKVYSIVSHGEEKDEYCVPIGEKYMVSGEWYVLAQTGIGYLLIGLKDGNRWSDPIRNFSAHNHKITLSDFQELLGSRHTEAHEVLKTRLKWKM